ncbi:hypothetical protein FS935_08380 [Metabacillus litoralis]|uniref:Uncharacterized protein n=2 Tax=Metabacillus litoralis TaxID=152268 RepID=A0A5C6W515_9BACI|nr:hypothetical protein FS935_08380 [Metabacillus litoralis]
MEAVVGGLFGLLFALFIPMQIVFAIKIKLSLSKLRRLDQITEDDALHFHKSMKTVLWVPYTTKYFNRMREAYKYIYDSPLVSFETKKNVHKSLKFRLVQGIPVPKQYHSAS